MRSAKKSLAVKAVHHNDENLDPHHAQVPSSGCRNPDGAEPVLAAEVEYILSKDLKPLEDADMQLKSLLARLASSEWLTVCEALNQVRQLSIFQPSLLLPIFDNVTPLVLKAVKNPRSALCKTGIMACADLFHAYQDKMLEAFDPLLLQLLLKASQDKKFVCEEAERALVGMTTCVSPIPLLHKLQTYTSHRNPRVRAKSATCISKSVSKLGLEGINEYGLDSLMRTAAAQLIDQLPEAREAARKLVVDLHAAYESSSAAATAIDDNDDEDVVVVEKISWEDYCSRVLSPTLAQPILRICCTTR